jgi:predicted secreted protein
MGIVSSIVVFLVIWWAVFFAVLPMRISQREPLIEGQDSGAPDDPRLWWKFKVTTAITSGLFICVFTAISIGLIDFREGSREGFEARMEAIERR